MYGFDGAQADWETEPNDARVQDREDAIADAVASIERLEPGEGPSVLHAAYLVLDEWGCDAAAHEVWSAIQELEPHYPALWEIELPCVQKALEERIRSVLDRAAAALETI